MKNIKNFIIGFVAIPIIGWVALLFASAIIGWVDWTNPLGFMGELIKEWVEGGIWKTMRTILTVSFVGGLLNIKIQNYLNNG